MRSVLASLNYMHETSVNTLFEPLQSLLVDEDVSVGRHKFVVRPEHVLKVHVHEVLRLSPVRAF